MEGSWLREKLHAEDSRAGELGPREPFGSQKIVCGSQMSDTERQDLDLHCWTSVLLWCDFLYAPALPFGDKKS